MKFIDVFWPAFLAVLVAHGLVMAAFTTLGVMVRRRARRAQEAPELADEGAKADEGDDDQTFILAIHNAILEAERRRAEQMGDKPDDCTCPPGVGHNHPSNIARRN